MARHAPAVNMWSDSPSDMDMLPREEHGSCLVPVISGLLVRAPCIAAHVSACPLQVPQHYDLRILPHCAIILRPSYLYRSQSRRLPVRVPPARDAYWPCLSVPLLNECSASSCSIATSSNGFTCGSKHSVAWLLHPIHVPEKKAIGSFTAVAYS
jgi:hypothetical protein